jgi:FGGY-family pentulose kinase
MRDHLMAVDIGSASARAGLFDRKGRLLARASFPIAMVRPLPDRAEHDSDDIWRAVCRSVRAVLTEAGKGPADVAALGFDATCSLVIRNAAGEKLPLSEENGTRFDTIVWLDHRARAEAEELSATGHPAVGLAGGRMSPEMAIPKLMWLKRRRPELWQRAGQIFDLADYATFRATGSTARSVSTLVSKWSYRADAKTGWSAEFLSLTGLDDLRERTGMPPAASPLATSLGTLAPQAAAELGLDTACIVAPGMIDAYAGTLGLLGALVPDELRRNPALIAGTSSCIAWLSPNLPDPLFSFWGPFRDVSVPGLWLTEGGQSAAGALLDHMVRMHAAGGEPDAALHQRIIERIEALMAVEGEDFGLPIDVLPDFHGNRSPYGDPQAWGMISGLTLDASFDGLCRLYWRTAVGIACGIRDILDGIEAVNGPAAMLHMAGGHARNPLLVDLYTNMLDRPVAVPRATDAVLLGTAMNAAAAAGLYTDLAQASRAMAPEREIRNPDPRRRHRHDMDYRRYQALVRHRTEMQALDQRSC